MALDSVFQKLTIDYIYTHMLPFDLIMYIQNSSDSIPSLVHRFKMHNHSCEYIWHL